MKTQLLRFVPLFVLPLTACSSAEFTSDEQSLLAECTGTFTCVIDGESYWDTLNARADGCYLGSDKLNPDGTIDMDGGEVRWSGNPSELVLCVEDTCFHCPADAPAKETEPVEPKEKECKGTADSCSGRSPGFCSDQAGCHLSLGPTLSTSDDYCYGGAKSCKEYSNEPGCKRQDGCRWE